MNAPIGRRGFVKAAALGAAVAGGGVLSGPAAEVAANTQVTGSRGRPVRTVPTGTAGPDVTSNQVSLYCSVADSSDYDSSGNESVTILCGNNSANPTTGSISLKFLTPFLTTTSVSDITAPSGWTVSELYNDNDSNSPSLYQIQTGNALDAGATAEVTVALSTASNTPNRTPEASARFSTDVSNTTDYETDLIQNYWTPGLDRTDLAVVTPGNANLVWGAQTLPFVPGGAAKDVQFSAVSSLAPLGPLVAQGIYVTSGSDTQGDLSTAHHAYTLIAALNTAV